MKKILIALLGVLVAAPAIAASDLSAQDANERNSVAVEEVTDAHEAGAFFSESCFNPNADGRPSPCPY